MRCPSCKSEYRPGITHCRTCDVDLEDEHDGDPARIIPPSFEAEQPEVEEGPMASYCGFLSLDDARAARDQLRGQRIPSEILIRDEARGESGAAAKEEFWLRVPVNRMKQVEHVLGFEGEEAAEAEPDEADDEEGGFACSDCGKTVAEHENTCPHCGAKFEE